MGCVHVAGSIVRVVVYFFLLCVFVMMKRICVDLKVEGFLGGERDYTKLKGDTGPLVYPAGFLYVYSAIRFLTGGEVFPAQVRSLQCR